MPLQDTPFFSIIITTYNREHLVERAVQSLLNQTETDWEAWVIDDGSTDQTEAVLRPLLKEGSKLHYYKQENQGVIGAKNKGIELALGNYIGFLDSDDTFKPNHLESRKTILQTHPEIDFLHGGVEIIGNQYVPDCYHPEKLIHLKDCAISGTFFIKQSAMIGLKGFAGDNLTTDAEFFERVKTLGLQLKKTDIATYVYHRDAGSSITKDMLK